MRFWATNVAQKTIAAECKISERTATDWSSFCREVVVHNILQTKQPIGGIGKTVEIDESKFGRRKYHRGHAVEGQWVFGGIQRDTGDCFLVPVDRRDRETLLAIIKDNIRPGTTIISDCWKAYDTLSDEGYIHLTVNHSINFVDPDTGAHTNTIESTWRHVKDSLPSYSRKKEFFGGYLAKFLFVKRCRLTNVDPTVEFFRIASTLYNPLADEAAGAMPRMIEDRQEDTDSDSD